jgi:hypothetical protein
MKRLLTALALLAGACSNPDNVVNGGANATATTPVVVFNTVGSSISGVVTRTDSTTPSWVVVLSDRSGLCDALALHPDLFRNAPGPYNAIVLFTPAERLGYFFIGRDQGTAGEIIAAGAAGPLGADQRFTASPDCLPRCGGYVQLSDFAKNTGDTGKGTFDMIFLDPSGVGHEFAGRFKPGGCPALQNALLP